MFKKIIPILLILMVFFIWNSQVINYVIKRSYFHHNLNWDEIVEVPGIENLYKPQGIAVNNDTIYFSNHWNDKKSRVYLFNKNNFNLTNYFDMPEEATHTSGLSLDSNTNRIWGADYNSNCLYLIDINKSLKQNFAHVLLKINTPLKGLSACIYVEEKNENYLVVSDFKNSAKTYILNYEKLINSKNFSQSVVAKYNNDVYSQGLEYYNGYLMETVNKIGIDVVKIYNFDLLLKNSEDAQILEVNGPTKMIEDITTDGNKIWTSDENTYLIYESNFQDLNKLIKDKK